MARFTLAVLLLCVMAVSEAYDMGDYGLVRFVCINRLTHSTNVQSYQRLLPAEERAAMMVAKRSGNAEIVQGMIRDLNQYKEFMSVGKK